MMNGHEKSDSAIVAVKPTNKAGQPAAEPGERRAGTEGNAGQQSTCRAQNRESVALDRVRTAARHRKKERFTTLFLRWTPLVRQLGWRVKRESRRIIAPYRCWP